MISREYHIPFEVQKHVDYITPGIRLRADPGRVRRLKRQAEGEKLRKRMVKTMNTGLEVIDASVLPPLNSSICDSFVTQECIRTQYSIPKGNKAAPGNELGIFESLGIVTPYHTRQSSHNKFSQISQMITTQRRISMYSGARFIPRSRMEHIPLKRTLTEHLVPPRTSHQPAWSQIWILKQHSHSSGRKRLFYSRPMTNSTKSTRHPQTLPFGVSGTHSTTPLMVLTAPTVHSVRPGIAYFPNVLILYIRIPTRAVTKDNYNVASTSLRTSSPSLMVRITSFERRTML